MLFWKKVAPSIARWTHDWSRLIALIARLPLEKCVKFRVLYESPAAFHQLFLARRILPSPSGFDFWNTPGPPTQKSVSFHPRVKKGNSLKLLNRELLDPVKIRSSSLISPYHEKHLDGKSTEKFCFFWMSKELPPLGSCSAESKGNSFCKCSFLFLCSYAFAVGKSDWFSVICKTGFVRGINILLGAAPSNVGTIPWEAKPTEKISLSNVHLHSCCVPSCLQKQFERWCTCYKKPRESPLNHCWICINSVIPPFPQSLLGPKLAPLPIRRALRGARQRHPWRRVRRRKMLGFKKEPRPPTKKKGWATVEQRLRWR